MKTKTFLTLLFFALSLAISAQTININSKIRNKTINRADAKVDQGIDAGLDLVEEGVDNAIASESADEADKNKEATVESNDENNPESAAEVENENSQGIKKQEEPKLESYSKYDFIAGEKIVFFDDFSQDAIADFPALWNTDASGEIVTMNNYPGRWFKMGADGSFIPDTKGTFPDNYTIELDLVPINNCAFGIYIYDAVDPGSFSEGGAVPGQSGIKIWLGNYSHGYDTYDENGYALTGGAEKALLVASQKSRISIWVQKQRIRVYVNETKIFDVVKAFKAGATNNVIRLLSSEDEPYVSNVRIAQGLPDMRSKLITEGKLVSYGIYFDVNSDKVKPESYGTLKGIAQVLIENPDVKIKIIGHTDGDGDAAANLDLSKRRAASVKDELNKSFGIDASLIETDGKGETEPVAPNDTPANKAQNRRVEFIKL